MYVWTWRDRFYGMIVAEIHTKEFNLNSHSTMKKFNLNSHSTMKNIFCMNNKEKCNTRNALGLPSGQYQMHCLLTFKFTQYSPSFKDMYWNGKQTLKCKQGCMYLGLHIIETFAGIEHQVIIRLKDQLRWRDRLKNLAWHWSMWGHMQVNYHH